MTIPAPAYAAVIALVVLATVLDLATRRIPNALTVSGVICGLGLSVWGFGWSGLLASLAGFGAGFLVLLPGYLLGFTGAGDVKLMAAVGSLLGARLVLYAVLLYLAAALVFALVYAVHARIAQGARLPFARYGGMIRSLATTGRAAYVRPLADEVMGRRLPMAPAIAFGAVAAPLLFG